MSYLSALYLLSCGSDYEPTPEELEAQRKYLEEQKEREKHTIFSAYQFQNLGRIEGESGGEQRLKINNLKIRNLFIKKFLVP